MFKYFVSAVFFFLAIFNYAPITVSAETSDADVPVYVFGRDGCGYCKAQLAWMEKSNIDVDYLNIITDPQAKILYDQVVEKHGLTKVTPITVIGEHVFVGFNGPETTGRQIRAAIKEAEISTVRTLEDHLANAPTQEMTSAGSSCTDLSCSVEVGSGYEFDLPFLGVVDLRSFSLFSLSVILGVIDGFNPCAMWVLITFLMILSQSGSRKKMIFLASIFILAEGIMYNLILNVWYKTWDFVALDQYVTPLVGILAFGGGMFFLWRWSKNKKTELVCDITNIETQSKTINKLKAIVNQPITIFSIGAILFIAFSVNIIEFACSIGIPQAYTKILELNMLSFMERQFYILIYTIGYMLDDLVVFAFAIWGYSSLQAHGAKYSQLSLLIGGVLMVLLGIILMVNPTLLVI
jgi:glutaredoxin/uncharacterized protein (UPF0333 family)